MGEEESSEGGPRVSISKGWEGGYDGGSGYQSVRVGRRRAMKVDLGYQSVRVGRVGRVDLGSKGWEGWARRAMKVDLGYQSVRGKGWEGWARRRAMKVDLGYQSVRGGRVGRGGEL